MASFDIAVGITQNGLNNTIASLFANPAAQSKIFKQTFSKVVEGITVSGELVMQNSPLTVMAPPSTAKWQGSYDSDGAQKTETPPAGNVFQVLVPNLKVDGTVAGAPVSGSDNIEVYATFSLANKVLNVTGLSVWVDESKWDEFGFTRFIVNAVIIPFALNTVNKLLNAIPFPQIPTEFTTTTFKEPVMQITNNNELVVATSMKDKRPPTNLDEYTPPASRDIFLQAGLLVINTLFEEELANFPLKGSGSTGNGTANASARIQGTLKYITANIKGGKTVASIVITDINGYGELAGTATAIAKTAMCPVGTAIDAISDPGNWDKIVSNFSIVYQPNPLEIPFSVNVVPKKNDEGKVKNSIVVSIGEIDSVQVFAAPKWSGVIGTALTTLAANFVNWLSILFKEKIVNEFVKKYAQNLEVWGDAEVEREIEGIKIKLSAETGSALLPEGGALIVQGFTISFPQ